MYSTIHHDLGMSSVIIWVTILPLRSAFGPEGNSNVDGQHPAPLGQVV